MKNKKSAPSWKLIIVCCIFIWPIGLYLWHRRIHEDRTAAFKSNKSMKIVGIVFMVIFAVYILIGIMSGYELADGTHISFLEAMAKVDTWLLLLFLGLGGIMLYRTSDRIEKNRQKYMQYIDLIINQKITTLENVAGSMNLDYQEVRKDLKAMIQMGYFTDAYIDEEHHEFVVADTTEAIQSQHVDADQTISNSEADNPYKESVKQIQRPKIVVCKCCGAQNRISTALAECEYCGSPLL